MAIAISAENVSKSYRLGAIGGATLKDDVNRWWARQRGAADPSLKIREEAAHHMAEQFYALRDVSFEVEEGEVVGVIGRNGAGKSTLLKLFSQVTAPSSGEVKIRGRIASLLEIGTGFHPELTGRENVFLNGAILGMTRAEVRRKFDEIVAFSGIEQFIDTPVKRYSSGMYVRLAFAVAAHLEPEILIVDEVLAVGDSEFQQKCLGKMHDVNEDGRTVLFVSHNMAVVQKLCRRAVLLKEGRVVMDGVANRVVEEYQRTSNPNRLMLGRKIDLKGVKRWGGNGRARITSLTLYDPQGGRGFEQPIRQGDLGLAISVEGEVQCVKAAGIQITDLYDRKIVNCNTLESGDTFDLREDDQIQIVLHDLRLRPGAYKLGLWLGASETTHIDVITDELPLEILPPLGQRWVSNHDGVYQCPFSFRVGREAAKKVEPALCC